MSKAHLTALAAALAFGAFAPRLAAQDTSSAGVARPDTSGYTGAGGVDTSARSGRVGAADTVWVAGDSSSRKSGDTNASGAARIGSDTMSAPGNADTDSTGAASDTSGMSGSHPDATKPGSTENPSGTTSPSSTSPSSTAPSSSAPTSTSPSSP